MAVGAVTLAASPLFFWFFMTRAQMGLDGAALAFITCQISTLVGLLGYVVYRAVRMQGKREQTWGGWSAEAFKDWGEYCRQVLSIHIHTPEELFRVLLSCVGTWQTDMGTL